MRQRLTVLAIAWTVSCAQVPPERKAVDDAAAALGGKDRLAGCHDVIILPCKMTAWLHENFGPTPRRGDNPSLGDYLAILPVRFIALSLLPIGYAIHVRARRGARG